jgi:hypothetical protein
MNDCKRQIIALMAVLFIVPLSMAQQPPAPPESRPETDVSTALSRTTRELLAVPRVFGVCQMLGIHGFPFRVFAPAELRATVIAIFERDPAVHNVGEENFFIPTPEPFHALAAKMGASTSSGGTKACYAGTLGMAATDNASGTPGYITNNHVAAARGPDLCPNGKNFDEYSPASGDSDQCMPGTKIGRLRQRLIKIKASSGAENEIDAAFVEAAGDGVVKENVCGLCVAKKDIVPAVRDMIVERCARSSKDVVEYAKVAAYNCAIKVRYESCVPGEVLFVDQIAVEDASGKFARDGDSGAVAVEKDGGIVGLLFAGDGQTFGFLNPMQKVVKQLKVTLDPPLCP